ncbi:hypothetical protein BC828DRAFT_382851 [Blastocladiella britannica]|nr:hypothetical protein BC828DRAFT_382851 [Blastocladiella britannica]
MLQLYAAAGLHLSDKFDEFSAAGGRVAIANVASTRADASTSRPARNHRGGAVPRRHCRVHAVPDRPALT